MPIWFISDNVTDLLPGPHTIISTALSQLVHNATIVSPYSDKPCFIILSGNRKGGRRYVKELNKLLSKQIAIGSRILVCPVGSHDYLAGYKRWHEFKPLDGHNNFLLNFEASNCTYLQDVLRQLPLSLTQSVTANEPKAVALQVHYELGDHADLAVAEASLVRKKAPPVEEHYDDCGDDVSAIELPEEVLFYDVASEPEDMFDSVFYLRHLKGSDNFYDSSASTTKQFDNMQSALTFLSTTKSASGHHDFCELYGGTGGVMKVGIRRRLTAGPNMDLTTGCDLSEPAQVAALFQYLKVHTPAVVVMAPPCTALGPWSSYNKVYHYDAWHASYKAALPLALLAAKVAQFQLDNGRHFIAENPWSSSLWQLPCWAKILRDSRVCTAYTEQCAFEIRDPAGIHTKKPTAFVASSELLLFRLRKTCDGTHPHEVLAGSINGISRCRYAQTWTKQLCEAVVAGILDVIATTTHKHYPVAAVPLAPCAACKQHAARDDPRHSRAGACRFPDDAPIEWSCGACKAFKHSSHSAHNHVVGECRWATVQPRASGSRTVRSRQPRVPQHAVAEAPEEEDETFGVPPPGTPLGQWWPIAEPSMITLLDMITHTDGWHQIDGGAALVSTNGRTIRTAEPRFEIKRYSRRSVYGFFGDHVHAAGSWWQLQDNADSKVCINISYPVPWLVVIFHRSPEEPSPFKNKPENPIAKALRDWAESDDEQGDASLEPADRWAGAPRVPPPPAPYVPAAPHDGEQDEVLPDQLQAQQEEVPTPPDWSSWDLGRALRALRSGNVGVITRSLRQLHLRWWHASSHRMCSILKHAGLPKAVIDLVAGVTDTCRICRLWAKPLHRAQATLRMATSFNDVVQVDPLFIGPMVILHCCDECIRWSACIQIASKVTAHILAGLTQIWLGIYGPPTVIIADHEGALLSEEASIYVERWGHHFALNQWALMLRSWNGTMNSSGLRSTRSRVKRKPRDWPSTIRIFCLKLFMLRTVLSLSMVRHPTKLYLDGNRRY